MEKIKEIFEKVSLLNLVKLTSLLDTKNTELISKNNTSIAKLDLWLRDFNLILLNQIESNHPIIDLETSLGSEQLNSNLKSKSKKKFKNCKSNLRLRVFKNLDEKESDFSDFVISDFIKNFKRNLEDIKKSILSLSFDNQYICDEKENMFIDEKVYLKRLSNLFSTENFTEKLSYPLNNIFTEIESKAGFSKKRIFDLGNSEKIQKRKRKSENKTAYNDDEMILLKQMKFENHHTCQSYNVLDFIIKTEDYDEIKIKDINLNLLSNIKNKRKEKNEIEDSKNMDIEMNKISKISFIDCNLNEKLLLNNIQISENFIDHSINNQIILEQPSKEQDISFTPKMSKYDSYANSFNDNNHIKIKNSEKDKFLVRTPIFNDESSNKLDIKANLPSEKLQIEKIELKNNNNFSFCFSHGFDEINKTKSEGKKSSILKTYINQSEFNPFMNHLLQEQKSIKTKYDIENIVFTTETNNQNSDNFNLNNQKNSIRNNKKNKNFCDSIKAETYSSNKYYIQENKNIELNCGNKSMIISNSTEKIKNIPNNNLKEDLSVIDEKNLKRSIFSKNYEEDNFLDSNTFLIHSNKNSDINNNKQSKINFKINKNTCNKNEIDDMMDIIDAEKNVNRQLFNNNQDIFNKISYSTIPSLKKNPQIELDSLFKEGNNFKQDKNYEIQENIIKTDSNKNVEGIYKIYLISKIDLKFILY